MTERILDKNLRGVNNLSFNPADLGMAPLPLNVLVPGTKVPADLFLAGFSRKNNKVEMLPATSKGEFFQEEWRDNLVKAGQEKVYVAISETQALTSYFSEYTKQIMDNPRTTRKEKSSFIHEMASFNLRLLFSSDMSQQAMERAAQSTTTAVDIMLRDNQILTRISELLTVDYTVYSHSVNVAMLAMAFGRFMEYSEGQVRALGLGGMLMEIGLAKIDKSIRDKPEKLTPEEEVLIKRHPSYAYDMLKMISAVPYDVLTIVRSHHENMNGTGYPRGLKGDSIPFQARILRVIDTYDALTSPRPYRPALSPMEAGQTLKEESGQRYDISVVTSFLKFMGSPYFTT